MKSEKQQLLIEYLLSSPDTFTICQSIVLPKYFDPELRNSVEFIKNYFDEYHTTPPPNMIKAETGIQFRKLDVKPDQIAYTTDEIEKFCKQKALEQAVIASVDHVKKGDAAKVEELVREAILVSLNRNLGLRYFEDPEARLQFMLDQSPVISTGWRDVDEALFGGYSRKELLLVSANSGGGKSITLSNLAFNAIHMGYNVLYISLELSEEIVAQRFDTMFTGIGRRIWEQHVSEIVTGVQIASEQPGMGILDIIQMKSGTTANEIRSYLKEFYLHHGFMPDVLVVDYLDKMGPNQTNIDVSDVWNKDKYCSEQLRDIGVDHNMAILSASQLNREAIKATSHDHSHIAGGISKINESDIYWSIKMDDVMRAQGLCVFKFQKTRNSDGVGKTVTLKWDQRHLRILDEDKDTGLTFKRKGAVDKNFVDTSKKLDGNDLLDLMTTTTGGTGPR